jgi:transcriptional regulator with XRE-family HTH domain
MARAALSWSRDDLAREAKVGKSTVVRFESDIAVSVESLAAMRSALEAGGVEFIPAGATMRVGGGTAGEGVRLRT